MEVKELTNKIATYLLQSSLLTIVNRLLFILNVINITRELLRNKVISYKNLPVISR
ncbi:hypothetical protein PALU110988_19370 [Paenibacillus lupini]|nr:hypothetical protein [Paenibacillus lupini]